MYGIQLILSFFTTRTKGESIVFTALTNKLEEASLPVFLMLVLMALGVFIGAGLLLLNLLFPDAKRDSQRKAHAYSEYLSAHQCAHIGHISVSRGRQNGVVHKQYQCANGLFLDYEIRNLVKRKIEGS